MNSAPLPTHQVGFTIIEVLVSITLLSVIILVILTPLTGLFGLTQRSDQQVTATQSAQRILETIRGDWLSAERYGKLCLTKALPVLVPPFRFSSKIWIRRGGSWEPRT